jgi:hypothetical protein
LPSAYRNYYHIGTSTRIHVPFFRVLPKINLAPGFSKSVFPSMSVSVETRLHETTKSQLTTENMTFKFFKNPHVDRFELAFTALQNHSITTYQGDLNGRSGLAERVIT